MESSPSVQKRQALYKSNKPSWKDAYRKRCQERLKNSRDKFLDRARSLSPPPGKPLESQVSVVENLMLEEWKILRSEQDGLPNIDQDPSQLLGDKQENLDDYLSIFEEIRTELLREEQQILREYEDSMRHEEEALNSSVAALSDDRVICPVCQKNPLHINQGVLFCHCGVRLDTEQDCVSLAYVRQNLDEGFRLHGHSCPGQPSCGVVNHVSIQNMLMTCPDCDFMHIIV